MLNLAYLAIAKALETVTDLKEVDWYADQFNYDDEQLAIVNEPAAYIEFLDTKTRTMAGKYSPELVDVPFVVHLYSFLGDTTGNTIRKGSLQHFNLFNAVSKALRGYAVPINVLLNDNTLSQEYAIQNVTRKGFRFYHMQMPWLYSTVRFDSIVLDYSTAKQSQTIQAALDIIFQ
jgi:hypothetical protein